MDQVAPPTPPSPTGPAPVPAGATGPATTTPQPMGMQARAHPLVDVAMKPLREALRLVEPGSKEDKAILKALNALSAVFGAASPDLGRAEMKMLGEKASTATPANPAAFLDMMRQQGANAAGRPAPALAPQTPVMAGA